MLIGVLIYIIIISFSLVIILVDSNWVLCAHCQLFKGERVTTSVSELQLNAECESSGGTLQSFTFLHPSLNP